jgi:glucose-6-phosphate-specific signal transduction histidine kinase
VTEARTARNVRRTSPKFGVETIREYVAALGGELHLTAVFPNETVEFAAPTRAETSCGEQVEHS